MIDPQEQVWLRILNSQLVNVCDEMGRAMMRTAYSTIFSEGLDFTAFLLDPDGDLIAMANMNPAMLGQALYSGRWVIDELDDEGLQPGDVIIHNDPYRGGSHMPEHLLVAPFYYGGELRGYVCSLGHMAEIGGMAPGSFASNATTIYQEGLRLPPVKIVREGVLIKDVWRIILTNHRTPENSWGDLHALLGGLNVGAERLKAIYDEHGADSVQKAIPKLFDYAEEWIRNDLRALPDGTYCAEECQEDDGIAEGPVTIRLDAVLEGDRLIVDYSRSDPQATGPINSPWVVTASATYNGLFYVIGDGAPINAGSIRPIDIIAPPGTVVNVRHPGPCVGGQTELQPRIIDMIEGQIFGPLMPERVSASSGGTCTNFLFAGVHPDTGSYYTNYHFEGCGWGGRAGQDGNSAQVAQHANCANTPVEIFESRFPWLTEEYALATDSAGAGTHRGGLGSRRVLVAAADEINISVFADRSKVAPEGLFGGSTGGNGRIAIQLAGTDTFRSATELYGFSSPTKFANVLLTHGDKVMLLSPGGGGFGNPVERDPEAVALDVANRAVSASEARERYGVVLDSSGAVDSDATTMLRASMR